MITRLVLAAVMVAACGSKQPTQQPISGPGSTEDPPGVVTDTRTEIEKRRAAACEATGERITRCAVEDARKEHQAFYRRVLRLSPVCEPRPYPTLVKPLGLMTTHYPSVRDAILQSYPFFRSTFFERRKLFERPADHNVMPLAPEPANINQAMAASY